MLPDCANTAKELKYTVTETNMKDYLELYFSEFLIIISIINLVLLGYLAFYLKKHKYPPIYLIRNNLHLLLHIKKKWKKEWKRR